MRNAIVPTSFLRRVWWADAAVSAVVGAAMAGAAGPLGELIGLPARLLAVAGLSLLPYAAFLAWLATRSAVPRAAAWAPVLLNVVWAIDCIALAVMQAEAGPLLIGFIAVQVVTVLAFAELEFGGLRRRRPPPRPLRPEVARAIGYRRRVARAQDRSSTAPRIAPASIASTRCAASPSSGWRSSTSATTSTTSASSSRTCCRTRSGPCSAPASSPCSCSVPAPARRSPATRASRSARFWRRWAQIAGCALLVSAASWLMFPRTWISFGVLHGIAVMLIVVRFTASWGAWRLLLGAVAIALPRLVQHPFFDSRATDWIGLVTHLPVTEDYVPVLPWLGVMWWGAAADRLAAAPSQVRARRAAAAAAGAAGRSSAAGASPST